MIGRVHHLDGKVEFGLSVARPFRCGPALALVWLEFPVGNHPGVTLRYTTFFRAAVSATPLALALMLQAVPARADTVIAGDLDYAVAVNSDMTGAGFGIRLGQQMRLPPLLSATPELAYTFHNFDSGPHAYRGAFGLRLGFGEVLRPGLFAHLGLGHLVPEQPAPASTAFTYDAGVFLDFTLLPILNLGIHSAYTGVSSTEDAPSFRWITLGLHAALVF
jgi:hypothetical protein